MEHKIRRESINEEKLKENARKISIKEGSAFHVSEGLGMRYITPYALALGANTAHIGFLSSLPSLLGNLSQLFTLKIIGKFKRKKIVFFGALSQAIMWLVILSLGILFIESNIKSSVISIFLIIAYSVLIICGAFFNPVWVSWMRDLVSKNPGNYFGMRSRIVSSVSLVCLIIAGLVLDFFGSRNRIFVGFAILFSFSFIARTASAILLTKKYEPEFKPEKEHYFTFLQFLKKMHTNNFGKFVVFISLMQLATSIASPFFAVYMLKSLNLSYTSFTVVTMASALSSLLFVQSWGKFSDSYGNMKVMRITSMFIPVIPLLWFFSRWIFEYSIVNIVLYLSIVEALSGIAWAGFNLSSGNFVYDAVTRQRIAICSTYFNIFNSAGVFIGAIAGGILASSKFSIFGLTPLLIIFLISFFARMAARIVMMPKLNEVRSDVKHLDENMKKSLCNLKASVSCDFSMLRKIYFSDIIKNPLKILRLFELK